MEHDPLAILDVVHKCATEAIRKLDNFIPSIYSKSDIAAVGITNQRETVVVWDKHTGKPLHNAIGKHLFFMHIHIRINLPQLLFVQINFNIFEVNKLKMNLNSPKF